MRCACRFTEKELKINRDCKLHGTKGNCAVHDKQGHLNKSKENLRPDSGINTKYARRGGMKKEK